MMSDFVDFSASDSAFTRLQQHRLYQLPLEEFCEIVENGTADLSEFIQLCMDALVEGEVLWGTVEPLIDAILFGKYEKNEFVKYLYSLSGASRCVVKWNGKHTAYRCKECGVTPSSCICVECFNASEHQGHTFSLYTSTLGGCCDCGDENAWKKEGNCSNHSSEIKNPLENLPEILIRRISLLFSYLVQLLPVCIDAVCTHVFISTCDYLNNVGGYHDSLRRLIWMAFLGNCRNNAEKDIKILELMFSYELDYKINEQEAISTLYMQLLFDSSVKPVFTRYLMKHYRKLVLAIPSKPEISKSLDKLTVQLFTHGEMVQEMVMKEGLLDEVLGTLLEFLSLTCTVQGNVSSKHSIIEKHQYWSVTHDLRFMMSHPEVAKIVLSQKDNIKIFLRLLSLLQSTDSMVAIPPNQNHILFEYDGYSRPFFLVENIQSNVELVIKQWKSSEVLYDFKSMEMIMIETMDFLFNQMNSENVWHHVSVDAPILISNVAVSLHCPLHRLFTFQLYQWILSGPNSFAALGNYLEKLDSRFENKKVLLGLLEGPLRCIVQLAEFRAGMWVRNGLDAAGPCSMYSLYYWQDLYLESDIMLIQILSHLIPTDIFLRVLMTRFNCTNFFAYPSSIGVNSTLIYAFLSLLLNLITTCSKLFLSDEQIIQRDSICMLSCEDRSFSYIVDRLATRHSDNRNIREIVSTISDTFQTSALSQRLLRLNSRGWSLYNPFSVYFSEKDRSTSMEKYFQMKSRPGGPPAPDCFEPISHPISDEMNYLAESKQFSTILLFMLFHSRNKCRIDAKNGKGLLLLEITLALLKRSANCCKVPLNGIFGSEVVLTDSSFNFEKLSEILPNLTFFENLSTTIFFTEIENDIVINHQFSLITLMEEICVIEEYKDVVFAIHVAEILKIIATRCIALKSKIVGVDIQRKQSVTTIIEPDLKSETRSERMRKAKEKQANIIKQFQDKQDSYSKKAATTSSNNVNNPTEDSSTMHCGVCLLQESAGLGAVAYIHRTPLIRMSMFSSSVENSVETLYNEILPLLTNSYNIPDGINFSSSSRDYLPDDTVEKSNVFNDLYPSFSSLPTYATDRFPNMNSSSTNTTSDSIDSLFFDYPAASSSIPVERYNAYASYELKRLNDDLAIQIRFCGHFVHQACYDRFYSDNKDNYERMESQGSLNYRHEEFYCPECRRKSNCLMPYVSDVQIPKLAIKEFTDLPEKPVVQNRDQVNHACSFQSRVETEDLLAAITFFESPEKSRFAELHKLHMLHKALQKIDDELEMPPNVLSPKRSPFGFFETIFNDASISDPTNADESMFRNVVMNAYQEKIMYRKFAFRLNVYRGIHRRSIAQQNRNKDNDSNQFSIDSGLFLQNSSDWKILDQSDDPKKMLLSMCTIAPGREIILSYAVALLNQLMLGEISFRHMKQTESNSFSIMHFSDGVKTMTLKKSIRMILKSCWKFHEITAGGDPWSCLLYECSELLQWNARLKLPLAYDSIKRDSLCSSSIRPISILCLFVSHCNDQEVIFDLLNSLFTLHIVQIFNGIESWLKLLSCDKRKQFNIASIYNAQLSEVPPWLCHMIYWITVPFLRQASLLLFSAFEISYSNIINNETFDAVTAIEETQHEYNYLCQYLHLNSLLPFLILQGSNLDLYSRLVAKFNSSNPLSLLQVPLIPSLRQLPSLYQRLYTQYMNTTCSRCCSTPTEPAICLLCSRFVCVGTKCCSFKPKRYSADSPDYPLIAEASFHANVCGAGIGVFLILRLSNVLMLMDDKRSIWCSLYLDENDEEDLGLRRGRALYLSTSRYNELQRCFISGNLSELTREWMNDAHMF